MPSGKPITDADRLMVLRLLRSGHSLLEIWHETGIHRQTVAKIVREAAVAWLNHAEGQSRLENLLHR